MMMIGRTLLHYRLERKLGEGGMGTVYEALDSKLQRRVAIKILSQPHPHYNLLKEARAAARLNHPNIVTIHELGSADGITFLVMELLRGQTLRTRLEIGALPLQEVHDLGIQIADALQAAHGMGIIHRDIKPSNLMITGEGRVKVMDFGLARLVDTERQSSAEKIVGTPAYLSPEQVERKPATNRSDIFAVGAVLYEAITGRRAFAAESVAACLAAILYDEPEPLPEHVPQALADVVQRCLCKNEEDRFSTATELKEALSAISLSAGTPATPARGAAATRQTVLSIAILPFENRTSDKENEYFGDGLAEEILNALAKLSGWRVASRTSAFAFRDNRDMDLRRIGSFLNVEYVLEGSVQRAGNRLRVAVHLIQASDGFQVWSERYDRDIADVFDVQDEISASIVGALKGKLAGKLFPAARRTRNFEASQWFWKGRFHMAQATKGSLSLAANEFEQAINLDPDYADPNAALASFYNLLAYLQMAPAREVVPLARQSALRALHLDPDLDEAHEVLAATRLTLDYDWFGAEEIFARLLAKPNVSSRTLYRYAFQFLLPLGRFEQAIELNQRALTEDPLAPMGQATMAACYYFSRRYQECIEFAGKRLNGPINFWPVDLWAGASLLGLGRPAESVEYFTRAHRIGPADALISAFWALSLKRLGQPEEAAQIWKDAANKHALAEAVFWIDDGEEELVMDLLHLQITERHQNSARVGVDPLWDKFRAHPRYKQALRRMNLDVDLQPLTVSISDIPTMRIRP